MDVSPVLYHYMWNIFGFLNFSMTNIGFLRQMLISIFDSLGHDRIFFINLQHQGSGFESQLGQGLSVWSLHVLPVFVSSGCSDFPHHQKQCISDVFITSALDRDLELVPGCCPPLYLRWLKCRELFYLFIYFLDN